jgi:hypothetical protein
MYLSVTRCTSSTATANVLSSLSLNDGAGAGADDWAITGRRDCAATTGTTGPSAAVTLRVIAAVAKVRSFMEISLDYIHPKRCTILLAIFVPLHTIKGLGRTLLQNRRPPATGVRTP